MGQIKNIKLHIVTDIKEQNVILSKITQVIMMDDVSLKKREIEAKLEEETASMEWLKESLKKSDKLSTDMLNILTSFEERLCKLEDTILPVHKETTDLQRRQENVDKTLVLLDEVLNFHNVSNTLKSIIETGPAGNLSEYLESMEKMDEAVQFFLKNNPESMELSILKSLNDTAKENLEKEFRLLLTRNSRPVPVVTIQDILNNTQETASDDTTSVSDVPMEEHIQHFSERVMNELKQIADWLTENRKGTDYMSIYSQVRATILQQSLNGVKVEGFRFDFVNLLGKKKAKVKRTLTENKNTIRKTKQDIESYRKVQAGSENVYAEDEEVKEVASFITMTGALLKLLQSELQLMQSIIPEERQIPIFSGLVKEALVTYFSEAEILCRQARDNLESGRLDHSAVQIILPVLKYLRVVKTDFDGILKMVNVDTRNRFYNVIVLLNESGESILQEFCEKLNESDKLNMPRDGTVHQITSNVTIFLEELITYLDTTAFILQPDKALHKPSLDDLKANQLVADYLSKVLAALSLNLTNNSKLYYNTSALQSIFILNNYNYIVKSLHKIGVMKMLQENGKPNLEREYEEAIEEEMKTYERSWMRVSQHLEPDATDKALETTGKMHIKDKHKEAIKGKFKGFNSELEEIKHVHQQWHVPDMLLKKKIFGRISEMVVPKYSDFLRRYRDVHFTKNVEKYIKYDVERVRKIVAHIYDLKDAE